GFHQESNRTFRRRYKETGRGKPPAGIAEKADENYVQPERWSKRGERNGTSRTLCRTVVCLFSMGYSVYNVLRSITWLWIKVGKKE
ncbi:hypothetical protein, partial [Dialister succinatiphilus]|uniref:hypothetical protein n=1 Tax=Dialister succinatiphilus TaxID=487173 RepID=UPI0040258CD6